MARLSKFIDTSKCTACRGCQTICKSWNEMPAEILEFRGTLQTHADTSSKTLTFLQMQEKVEGGQIQWHFRKHQCFHCAEAACIVVCPEKALSHSATGAVVRDYEKCIGCEYCSKYCPFNIPKVDQDLKKMFKCTLCSERVDNNRLPACAQTCPPGAILFGDRAAMVAQAKERLVVVKELYPNANLYGLDDQFLSGTNVFYLLLESPEYYGLPKNPVIPAAANLWQNIIQPMGKVLPLGALGALMVSAFLNRVTVNKGQDNGKGGAL